MNKLLLLSFLALSELASSHHLISVEDITDANVEHLENQDQETWDYKDLWDEEETFTLYDAENQEEVEARFEDGHFVNKKGERVFSEEDYESYDEEDPDEEENESYDEGKFPKDYDGLYHDWVIKSIEDEEGYDYY